MIRFALSAFVVVALLPAAASADDEKGYLGVQIKLDDGKIVVMAAIGDSPAEKAGLKQGDIITKIGDFVPTTLEDFVNEVGKGKPGSKVTIVVTRDGKETKLTAMLGKRPE